MKSIKIKGKDYITVNERIKYFQEFYENWSLISEIISPIEQIEDFVCIKATVLNPDGRVITTGHAHEVPTGQVNSTSHIENCETSAWGRALGCLGIGIDTSIASAEEMERVDRIQNTPPKTTSKYTKSVLFYLLLFGQHMDWTKKESPKYNKGLFSTFCKNIGIQPMMTNWSDDECEAMRTAIHDITGINIDYTTTLDDQMVTTIKNKLTTKLMADAHQKEINK